MSSPLGRGLGAIIPNRATPAVVPQSAVPVPAAAAPGLIQLSVGALQPNPRQARQVFEHGAMEELVASIEQHGILVPLVVTPVEHGVYQIVAGERRWRAAKLAGLATVPCLVRDANELEQMELGLIENIQREDLNVLELAAAYQTLADEFSLTQDQIAQRVGKARTSVTNTLRLLQLPAPMQKAIADGQLTFAHAKVLLSVAEPKRQRALFEKILAEQLSVRAASISSEPTTAVRAHRRRAGKDPALQAMEVELQNSLGSKVRISTTGAGGEVIITYYDAAELRRIRDRLL